MRKRPDGPNQAGYLEVVGDLARELQALGLDPVLVGGMALVIMGSRRVTRDFDFVVGLPGDRLAPLVDLFYDRGLELVSRLDDAGNVTSTIANRKVAAIRLRIDAPSSAYFFNAETGLRVDLLFDFPVAATTLLADAVRTTVQAQVFSVASADDLLQLKKIARNARKVAGDAEDIAFLETYLHSER